MSDAKSALRARLRAYIKTLPQEYIASSDAGIMSNVLRLEAFRRAGTVFAYYAVGRECATAGITGCARAAGKIVALPRSGQGGIMDFAPAGAGLRPGMFGIPEPDPAAPALSPLPGDIILVPAVCCDRSGMRLGQGGGYYDRFLEKYPDTVTACLCRERLLQEKIPTEWNDRRVDFVITERDIIKTGP